MPVSYTHLDVYKRQYMDRPADTREGCKHRCTNAAMEYFKSLPIKFRPAVSLKS